MEEAQTQKSFTKPLSVTIIAASVLALSIILITSGTSSEVAKQVILYLLTVAYHLLNADWAAGHQLQYFGEATGVYLAGFILIGTFLFFCDWIGLEDASLFMITLFGLAWCFVWPISIFCILMESGIGILPGVIVGFLALIAVFQLLDWLDDILG